MEQTQEKDRTEAHNEASGAGWSEVLLRTTVDDFLRMSGKRRLTSSGHERSLVTLSSADTIHDVLQTLAHNGILSAPVMDSSTLEGLVDVLDIAGFLLHDVMEKEKEEIVVFSALPSLNQPISLAVNYSLLDRPVPIKKSNNMLDVVAAMCNPKGTIKVHRLPVFDDDGNIIDIISQSDVVAWYAKNIEQLPAITKKNIVELDLAHAVISVRNDTTLVNTLSILFENRVNGVAVLSQGRLVGNISASDLRGFGGKDFDPIMFRRPVQQMLDRKAASEGNKPPVSCTLNTTLGQVISLLAANRTHRVYVVDEEDRAIGVITLSDVLRALLPENLQIDERVDISMKSTISAKPPKHIFTSKRSRSDSDAENVPCSRATAVAIGGNAGDSRDYALGSTPDSPQPLLVPKVMEHELLDAKKRRTEE